LCGNRNAMLLKMVAREKRNEYCQGQPGQHFSDFSITIYCIFLLARR
jgi:hypothetical protein